MPVNLVLNVPKYRRKSVLLNELVDFFFVCFMVFF